LDGTAKGGVVLAIAQRLKIPIRFIGVGEQSEDFGVFNASEFVSALLKSEPRDAAA
jgi:fused signal recognition particle receptor